MYWYLTQTFDGKSLNKRRGITCLCFCDSVSGELNNSKVSPANGLLNLVESDFERGAAGGVAGGLVHAGAEDRAVKAHHHSYSTLNLKQKIFKSVCLFWLAMTATTKSTSRGKWSHFVCTVHPLFLWDSRVKFNLLLKGQLLRFLTEYTVLIMIVFLVERRTFKW